MSSIAAMPAASGSGATNISASSAAQFREIHKNTWLKRLTAEGKKITVGPKKSERSWVVFCVHDDTEALLEGYAEPRQAPCHFPEWVVPLQSTLHISHALIPHTHEFEFVVTLSNEVVRFHAMSWEIMQEWVETLRSKLREMKILSPRENLYTKLPEIRAPLLPTRDPTSPLPAPPPVPAALVPGVERVVSHNSSGNAGDATITIISDSAPTTTTSAPVTTSAITALTVQRSVLTSMSNTLTQNLLNMLSDPMSAYSEQLNDEAATGNAAASSETADVPCDTPQVAALLRSKSITATDNNSVRVDISGAAGNRSSAGNTHIIRPDIVILYTSPVLYYTDTLTMLDNLLQCEPLIPRPQTSRSLSAGAVDKTCSTQDSSAENLTESETRHVTELEISSRPTASVADHSEQSLNDSKANITIIQVSTHNGSGVDAAAAPPQLPAKTITGEVFKFPEQLNKTAPPTAGTTTATAKTAKQDYKSNVQIIPSSANSSTIQVLSHNSSSSAAPVPPAATAIANQYSTPVKKPISTVSSDAVNVSNADNLNKLTTTVHVVASGDAGAATSSTTASVYGTCYASSLVSRVTPKLPKKIITANIAGVTNIAVNNASASSSSSAASFNETLITVNRCGGGGVSADAIVSDHSTDCNVNVHYEKVFLSSSIPVMATKTANTHSSTSIMTTAPSTPKLLAHKDAAHHQSTNLAFGPVSLPNSPAASASRPTDEQQKTTVSIPSTPQQQTGRHNRNMSNPSPLCTRRELPAHGSPAVTRRRLASPISAPRISTAAAVAPPQPACAPLLTRGLTEAVITSRPSRRDFHFLSKLTATAKAKASVGTSNCNSSRSAIALTSNNNDELPSTSATVGSPLPSLLHHVALHRANSESLEQRRRSSSTSDAQAARGSSTRATVSNANNNSVNNCALRIQQPPQPFRSVENAIGSGGSGSGMPSPTVKATSPATKRITLREQQVLQLRREIMHPGGVRLQLRRKDCVGSVAWVDAFGAVWVAGWKQKEHPVLYNALHIGDQLLSIAGVTVNTSVEANKIIRNANTLFVEVLVRRLPFGRGYAIRREREGQCLGLIRDGNTATIVDVVPNSLAARHGLPPKAQSCDGTTLTFWVLTEINGRPLSLFFKDNEIRDRLNSVGRDISILVQPADLIAKLKKQLKSLRGYKDYLVQ